MAVDKFMDFRLAVYDDLEQVKSVFREIIRDMNNKGIDIWDDFYPVEFFKDDIKEKRLYLMLHENTVVSAFALYAREEDTEGLKWKNPANKALYLARFGVNPQYAGKGAGSMMLRKAKETAKNLGAESLRILVVERNKPAISFYEKNKLIKAHGMLHEEVDDGIVIHEYGYEAEL